jgi:exodeoxyribonuclease VII large subunit
MKKGREMGDDQLSFLGSAEEKSTKAARKVAPVKPVRMPSMEPMFGMKLSPARAKEEKISSSFVESKKEALSKLETLAPQKVASPTESDQRELGNPQPTIETQSEPQVFSVSEINQAIRGMLESNYNLVWLKGEISNFKPHSSGHFYFSLKDQKAQINAVMFRQHNSRLGFKPQDGMEVLVRGKITVYEPRGTYQIFCELMDPVGLGALQMAYEQLKRKLENEGLFDLKRKRPLPSFPTKVVIVTSPTGAAIKDMLNVLGRRFRALDITLIPVSVQGEKAPREIIDGIELANKIGGYDVMIVGRGGGSIEDLWAFNNENVCRAIAASQIPIVSAVGHEIDFTLADFVADLRAPTPSAAAELIVKNVADLCQALEEDRKRLLNLTVQGLRRRREMLSHIEARVVDPQRRIQDAVIRCDELVERLTQSSQRKADGLRMKIDLLRERLGTPRDRINRIRQQLDLANVQLQSSNSRIIELKWSQLQYLNGKMDSLSPLKVVERGFALVTADGKIVRDHKQIKVGDELSLKFARGEAKAIVKSLREDGIESEMENLGIPKKENSKK